MTPDDLRQLFDQQAAGYDAQWQRTAPIRESLLYLLGAVFAPLPADARALCVGAGTGDELLAMARRFPGWRFTAVEPSGEMLARCRGKVVQAGFADRCDFHEGYVADLPVTPAFDAATSLLVSQFLLDPAERTAFFRDIAVRLRPGGMLANADLAADPQAPAYDALLRTWFEVMAGAGVDDAGLQRMRAAYQRDVAVLPPPRVAALMAAAGFEAPVLFHQAGLIHAWFARRADPAR